MKKDFLNSINNVQFLEFINFFIMHKFKLRIDGNNLVLVYKNTKIELRDYKNLIDCSTLMEMKKIVQELISENNHQVKNRKNLNKIVQLSTLSIIVLNMLLINNTNKNDIKVNDYPEKEIISEETDAINTGKDVISKEINAMDSRNVSFDEGINIENYEPLEFSKVKFKPHENEEISIYDEYLRTYATYYNFDGNKVVKLARQLTNNYTIAFEKINNTDQYDITNEEAACLMFVSQLNRDAFACSLDSMGLNLDYFVLKAKSKTQIDYATLCLDNGLTVSQFVGKVCDLLQIDKNYVLAVIYFEVGEDLDCKCAREYHNFGGIKDRDTGEFIIYPSTQAGIIAMCRTLKRYEQYQFNNIYNFCGMYRFGNPERYSETWIDRVTWFHSKIANNSDYYFLPETREENLKLTR